MQAHTVLDSVAMVYTPLWNRARELAGVRVAVRATHPRGVDAPHLLQAIGEDWPEGAPPLVLFDEGDPEDADRERIPQGLADRLAIHIDLNSVRLDMAALIAGDRTPWALPLPKAEPGKV